VKNFTSLGVDKKRPPIKAAFIQGASFKKSAGTTVAHEHQS
jgi:hypothetical protein